MSPPRRLAIPLALVLTVIVETGCSRPNPTVSCPPPGADAMSLGNSLNNYPVVSWNGVAIELLPDGGCEAPPTV